MLIAFLFPIRDQNSIVGIWITSKGDAKIEIYERNGNCYGKIVWLKKALDKNKRPLLDSNNPDESLRNRKIIGSEILKDFVCTEENLWEGGTIYEPDSGDTYSAIIEYVDGHLEVRGYMFIALLGRTVIWYRAN